jgi:surface polysaccharide O-acyltransferase-like enzyme
MKQIKTRNTTIDSMRLIFAFLVVFIHAKYICTESLFYDSTKLQILDFIAKLAVPFFFMVSGYYLFNKKQDYIITQIKKLATLYIVALIIFLFVFWALNKFNVDIFSTDTNTIPVFLFYNTPAFGPPTFPLWFISASIYIYIYMYFAQKYKIPIEITVIISVAIFIYDVSITDYKSPLLFINKFFNINKYVLFHFIFFILGYIIASKKSEILSIKKTTLLFLTALVGALSYIEYHELIIASVKDHTVSIHIFYMLPILISLIFILSIAFPNIRAFEFLRLPQLGRQYALYVYLIHIFYIAALGGQIRAFSWLFPRINEAFSIDMIIWLTTPTVKHEIFIWLLICLLSLLTAVIVEKIVKICSPIFHKIF